MSTGTHYPFAEVEDRARRRWEEAGAFAADEKRAGEKFYCLSMFPYPSGRLHMGHARNYAIGDMIARHQRMRGRNVLQPLGWDAFGLPAENAAIDNNIAPAVWTRRNIGEMRAQLKRLGLAIDWRRELATCDPAYYRWEQQFFVRLFQKQLIYKKKATVNWDPADNTVLANEQVVDGRGWRSGAAVERRDIPMYFMRITAYADELLEELDNLRGWPESVKTMQRNWIGRSEGARVLFPLAGRDDSLACFSTRPDTLFGATFCAVAPEHPLAAECAKDNPQLADFVADCRRLAVSEEALEKTEKRGIDTGLRAVHPFDSSRQLPVYVANFVLMQYGSGAIFGCPAHDQRDLDFARRQKLPVIPVVRPDDGDDNFAIENTAYTGDGAMFNSEFLNGMRQQEAIGRAIDELETLGRGERRRQYRLRDWGVSRQRYWGCPIPIVHCDKCGDVAEKEENLPVLLPEDAAVDGRGSPLAKMESFVSCACPQCGAAARRETDTLDTFVESSWYFARFASSDCDSAMIDNRAAYWMPVNHYIGGIEHACLHLLYARFFHKLMRDSGMYAKDAQCDEPFSNLLCQGMVLNHAYYRRQNGGRVWRAAAEVTPQTDDKGKIVGGRDADGAEVEYAGRVKMSKSFNNGVDPEKLIAEWGADTARLFILFAAPPEQSLNWSDEGVRGCARFLNRLWFSIVRKEVEKLPSGYTKAEIGVRDWLYRLKSNADKSPSSQQEQADAEAVAMEAVKARARIHEILAKANYDMERLRFNNIPSAAMSMVNEFLPMLVVWVPNAVGSSAKKVAEVVTESTSIVLRLLAPATPHIAQELWERMEFDKAQPDEEKGLICNAPWPQADEKVIAQRSTKTLAVQVNGKLRGQLNIAADADKEAIEKAARELPGVQKHLPDGGKTRKVVVIPGKVVNFVL